MCLGCMCDVVVAVVDVEYPGRRAGTKVYQQAISRG